jgi:hypothetical protein
MDKIAKAVFVEILGIYIYEGKGYVYGIKMIG